MIVRTMTRPSNPLAPVTFVRLVAQAAPPPDPKVVGDVPLRLLDLPPPSPPWSIVGLLPIALVTQLAIVERDTPAPPAPPLGSTPLPPFPPAPPPPPPPRTLELGSAAVPPIQ